MGTRCALATLGILISLGSAAEPATHLRAAAMLVPEDAGCSFPAVSNDNSATTAQRAPSYRNRFGRSVYLILASEVAASGLSEGMEIAGIGWTFGVAPGVSGLGPLTVYMQNTTDTVNNKSTSWASAIAGMTVVHDAWGVIPDVTGPFDIPFQLGSPFVYSGAAIYVAFDAGYPTGNLSTSSMIVCNRTGSPNGLKGAEGAAPPTTLGSSSFRPETRLISAVPGPVGISVEASHDGTSGVTALTWNAIPLATGFNTYRGTIPDGMLGSRPQGYDHVCYESGDGALDGARVSEDSSAPPQGMAYYYLMSGKNLCGEGSLGVGLNWAPRPNPSPCPAP